VAQPAHTAQARSRNLRNAALALILGAIGIGAVMLVTGGQIDLSPVRSIRVHYLVACLVLVVMDWVSEAVRLTMLSRALGEQVSVATVLRIVFLGAFFARITPFDSGGEPFQVYALHRNGFSLGHATAVIAVKALLHGLARVCLGVLIPIWLLITAKGWHLGRAATIAMYVGMAVYTGIAGLLLLIFVLRGRAPALIARLARHPLLARMVGPNRLEGLLRRVEGHFVSFVAAIGHFGNARRKTIYAVGLISLVSWAAVLSVPVILVRALGGASPVAEIAATAIIFYLAVAYAPTPGSSGASELGFATLFARFVPLPLVGVLVLLWRLFTHYLSLVLGFAVTALSLGGNRRRPTTLVAGDDPALVDDTPADPHQAY
jgi:uncharacterized protein (TIRG00374 family)